MSVEYPLQVIGRNIGINQHHLRRVDALACQQLLRGQSLRSNIILPGS